jgi:hypothetical protein
MKIPENVEILTGPKGGKYYVLNGKKYYLKKTDIIPEKKEVPRKEFDATKLSMSNIKFTVYVNSVNLETHEVEDDFSEWCEAASKDEAAKVIEGRYPEAFKSGKYVITAIFKK